MNVSLKELIKNLLNNQKIEDISDKITLGGAWTLVFKKAYRVGSMAFFDIEAYTSSYVAGTEYVLATIASGYRPKTSLPCTGHTTNGSYTPQGVVNCIANTNGNIRVVASNTNGNYFFIQGFYEIA